MLDVLKRLIDPSGPIGSVVSPSDVYKERLGVPVTSPHTIRAAITAPREHIEHTLAPVRFATMDEAAPKDRVRQVSALVEEHWGPVYERTDSTDLFAILRASQNQVGWTVTQRESKQSRATRRARENAEDFERVMQTAQIQASDEFYRGYYETIPGNDQAVVDGTPLVAKDGAPITGGTQINSRKEWREKTKGMVLWDKGYVREWLAMNSEMNSRPVRNTRRALEDCQNALPMWRPTGINPRRDRMK